MSCLILLSLSLKRQNANPTDYQQRLINRFYPDALLVLSKTVFILSLLQGNANPTGHQQRLINTPSRDVLPVIRETVLPSLFSTEHQQRLINRSYHGAFPVPLLFHFNKTMPTNRPAINTIAMLCMY